ncbi:hypothetical protein KSS87_019319 [Heliosperma pusillum]|nr:hypothetical protein KSS87_019319 [Heliosperma pusillum]
MKTPEKHGKQETNISAEKTAKESSTLSKVKSSSSSSSSFLLGAIKLCNKKSKSKYLSGGPRCSCSTPVNSWMEVGGANTIIKGNPFNPFFSSQLSARKLAAVIWEFKHFVSPVSVNTMSLGVNNQRVRRNRHKVVNKDEGFDQIHQQTVQYYLPSSGFDPRSHATYDHHPASASSLRRHITASLMRHHKSTERNKHTLQPLSPASFGSSLEVAPFNPVATPNSSIELRGKIGDSSYSFKTSTELLKVLNRIWSLEEQHTSNVSVVKGLKTELHHARVRIKELLRDQQGNRHEIDQLMKKISDGSLSRKSKDFERTDAALQSTRIELEDERRLRKRSESLHRKLARELFEVKVAFATSVKEIEKEKKSSLIMEELCDEFAKGIINYVSQVHTGKQNADGDLTGLTDRDYMMLHMSESWLDERAQMKDRESQGIIAQRQPVIDKLRHQVETFLASRQLVESHLDPKDTRKRRCSLESIPEVVTVTAPENSAFSELHGAEVSKAGAEELDLTVTRKGRSTDNTPRVLEILKTSEETPTEVNMLKKSDIYDSVKEQRKKAYHEEGQGSNSKAVDKLISELLISEGACLPEVGSSNPSTRRNASPIRQWMTSMASPNPRISEPSLKKMSEKDSILKARLQETKLKEQRSRLKILKGLS